jgi:hypothetical protein
MRTTGSMVEVLGDLRQRPVACMGTRRHPRSRDSTRRRLDSAGQSCARPHLRITARSAHLDSLVVQSEADELMVLEPTWPTSVGASARGGLEFQP